MDRHLAKATVILGHERCPENRQNMEGVAYAVLFRYAKVWGAG